MSKQTFEALLGQYWDLAHFQGNSGVPQGDKAKEVLYALKKLAALPAQRKPLTDEEISEIAINNPPMVHEFARAIEAAHGIKENT